MQVLFMKVISLTTVSLIFWSLQFCGDFQPYPLCQQSVTHTECCMQHNDLNTIFLIIDYGIVLHYYILTRWEQPKMLFAASAGWKDLPILDNHPFWLNYNPFSCFRISLAMEKLWRNFPLAREAPPACPSSQETRTASWHQPNTACCGMFTHCLIPRSCSSVQFKDWALYISYTTLLDSLPWPSMTAVVIGNHCQKGGS